MRDVTFSGIPRAESVSLEIDSLLYQARPAGGFDDKLRAILRERRAFLSAFGVVMALGISYLVAAPREYLGEATVMAAPRNADLSRTDSVLNPTGAPEPVIVRDPDIEGEIQILSSPAALRRIVQQVRLDQPRPGEQMDAPSLSDILMSLRTTIGLDSSSGRRDFFTEVKRWFSAKLGLAEPAGEVLRVDPERRIGFAVETLTRKLKVAPIGRSTMINIQYTSPDPKLAALVATTAARNYIDTRFKQRQDAAAQASDFLRGRTDILRQAVANTEKRLADFRATVQSRGRDPAQLQDEMRVLGERIVMARADQQKAASRLTAAKAWVATDGPLSLLSWETGPGPDEYLVQERAIAEMRKEAAKLSAVQGPLSSAVTRLESEAQTLERRLAFEAQTRLNNLQVSADALKREVAALEKSMLAMRAEYDSLDAAATQLSSYENAAVAARTVYQNFATRLATTEQAGFNEAQGWLISTASVPALPAKPSIPLVLLGTLAAAVLAGVSRALWADYRDSQTIRSSEDVERHLRGVRLLGLLPELRSRARYDRRGAFKHQSRVPRGGPKPLRHASKRGRSDWQIRWRADRRHYVRAAGRGQIKRDRRHRGGSSGQWRAGAGD